MMNKLKKTAIPLAFIAALFFWHFSRKDLAATGIQWQCNSHDCKVSFDLENRSKDLLYKSLRIQAIHRSNRGKAGGMTNTVLAETTCPVEIIPQSTQRINRAIVPTYPGGVDLVTIKLLTRN